uniref:Retrotransposon Orf1 n=1 Tax=Tanacetum cinerariifolium TaxID=118510 RepID=A0A6L2JFF7_TANCI|nr:retrotransposon Orf1 [Tanacetum cinerariifolium]
MSKRDRNTTGQASSSRKETMEEKVCKFGLLYYEDHQMNYDNLVRYELLYKGVTFRDVATLSGLRREKTVNSTHVTYLFWPTIGDDMFNVENTKSKSIRDPRIKLGHCCIMITITGRKENTNRFIKIDLFYLYCIFGEGVVCNIPYWFAKYLKGVRDKSVIFKGMFVTKIAWSFEVVEKDKGDDEEGDEEGGNEGAVGSMNIYQNMSAGDWSVRQARWMDQQDHQ